MRRASGSRDRDDVIASGEQPGEGDLAGCGVLLACNLFHDGCGTHVGVKVFALEAWVVEAKVVLRIFFSALYVPREEATAKRRKRDKTNAKLAECGDDLLFQIALPERVFALQCRDGVNGMGATNSVYSGLGQTEIARFPFLDKISHRSDCVFD